MTTGYAGRSLRAIAARGRHIGVSVIASILMTACGGGGDSPPPVPPDLSGVWAGAWQGEDSSPGGLGLVSGTWEVEIIQGTTSASGTALLMGDVDCMDGVMQTNPDTLTGITGTLTRPGCASIDWLLTALNVNDGSASGSWTNLGGFGTGTLSGTRIARLGGPRISFVYPPGGKPDAIVTVGGHTLSDLLATALEFNGTAVPSSSVISSSATRVVARVPAGASSGPVRVNTTVGNALSPRSFSTDVSAPPLVLGRTTTSGTAPAAVAVSPDGRKLYIADRGDNSIRLVRASSLADLGSVTITGGVPRSVVASPDGRRIYVAVTGRGVVIMDAANLFEYGTIALPSINDQGRDNPQGLAVSPDGTLLLVSEGAVGGNAKLFRITDKTELQSFAVPAGVAPLGVAFSPDGEHAYVAAANLTGSTPGTLEVFNVNTGASVASVTVGVLPTAIAVSPSGNRVYVTNKGSGTVSIHDKTAPANPAPTTTVGTSPTGVAVSPDDASVYVTNRGSNTISVFDAASGLAIFGSPIDVSGTALQPVAIAINPMGTTAYVATLTTAPTVLEIGGMRTLTVVRSGTGIGTVRSDKPGIDCGTQCQAQYPVDTDIVLTATPASGSTFSGWSGTDCSGTLKLSTDTNCNAVFTALAPPPSSAPSGGCFIATAAYGSDMADDVLVLRRFRDERLMQFPAGREFVRLYYHYSPPLADLIRGSEALRAAVRGMLAPVVFTVKQPWHAASLLFVGLLLVIRWRRASAM